MERRRDSWTSVSKSERSQKTRYSPPGEDLTGIFHGIVESQVSPSLIELKDFEIKTTWPQKLSGIDGIHSSTELYAWESGERLLVNSLTLDSTARLSAASKCFMEKLICQPDSRNVHSCCRHHLLQWDFNFINVLTTVTSINVNCISAKIRQQKTFRSRLWVIKKVCGGSKSVPPDYNITFVGFTALFRLCSPPPWTPWSL